MPDRPSLSDISLLDLLLLPVVGPIRGLLFVLEQIRNVVDKELYDEPALQKKLVELQLAYEMGEIDEASYRETWDMITERIACLKEGSHE